MHVLERTLCACVFVRVCVVYKVGNVVDYICVAYWRAQSSAAANERYASRRRARLSPRELFLISVAKCESFMNAMGLNSSGLTPKLPAACSVGDSASKARCACKAGGTAAVAVYASDCVWSTLVGGTVRRMDMVELRGCRGARRVCAFFCNNDV